MAAEDWGVRLGEFPLLSENTNAPMLRIAIGVDDNGIPVASILEAAHLSGLRTGLVVTTRVSHATPACKTVAYTLNGSPTQCSLLRTQATPLMS